MEIENDGDPEPLLQKMYLKFKLTYHNSSCCDCIRGRPQTFLQGRAKIFQEGKNLPFA